jgi:FKBP-type peptidyl-prolyl cis-trans isomerase
MTIRIHSLTAAAALGLVALGCNKEAQSTPDKDKSATATQSSPVPIAPGATANAPSAASNGLVTTASGLQYQVLKRGAGTVSPKPTDTVNVHYHGTLLDGTVFDSSVERGQPISFPLNGVIKGWTEGLQLMKVGDKFKFVIPPYLAYGENSPSPKIPANSALQFEVELLGIQ